MTEFLSFQVFLQNTSEMYATACFICDKQEKHAQNLSRDQSFCHYLFGGLIFSMYFCDGKRK